MSGSTRFFSVFSPAFISEDSLLAKVDGVYNAVLIEGDLVDKVLFFGQGAGPLPTSSAVIADIVATAQEVDLGVAGRGQWRFEPGSVIKPMSDIRTRYYLRLNVADRPGVLAQIARVFGDHQISISSAIQKLFDQTDNDEIRDWYIIILSYFKVCFSLSEFPFFIQSYLFL